MLAPAQCGGGCGEESQKLNAKSTAGLDPSERERRRSGEPEKKEKAGCVRRVGPEARGLFTNSVRNLQVSLFAVALVSVPSLILGAATPVDDFYVTRLNAGKAEAASGRPYEAIDDLKIATFGFLDQPALLEEGLARLALAQAAAGRADDAETTMRRFVEVETRFKAWPQSELDAGTRSAFGALLEKRLGAEVGKNLLAPAPVPVFEPPVTPAVPVVMEPTALSAPSGTVLAESKTLVAQGRYVENLRKLVAAVAADPKDRDLRLALVEGATLTKDWDTAVAQLDSIRPFRDAEGPWMFYGAVALFEKGGVAPARDLARQALPRLSRSAFVDYYARKILGASGEQ